MSAENKFSMRDMETIYNSYNTGTTYNLELTPLSTTTVEGLQSLSLDGKMMLIDKGFRFIFKTETVIATATHPNFITKKTFPMLTVDAIRGYHEGVHNNIFIPIRDTRVYSALTGRLTIEMWTSIAGGQWEKIEKSKLWQCYLIGYEVVTPFKYPYVDETKGILLRTRILPTSYMDRSMVENSKFMVRMFFKHSPSPPLEILRTNSFPIYERVNSLQFFPSLGTHRLFERKISAGKTYAYEELVESKGFHISLVSANRPIKRDKTLMNEARDEIEKERILSKFGNLVASKEYIVGTKETEKRRLELLDGAVFPQSKAKKLDPSSRDVDDKFEMQLQDALFQEELTKSCGVVSASIFPFEEYIDEPDESKMCEDFFFGNWNDHPLEKIPFFDSVEFKAKAVPGVLSGLTDDVLLIDSILNDEEFMDGLCKLMGESGVNLLN